MYCVHMKACTMTHKNGLLYKYCFDSSLLEKKNFDEYLSSSANLVLDSVIGSTLFFMCYYNSHLHFELF